MPRALCRTRCENLVCFAFRDALDREERLSGRECDRLDGAVSGIVQLLAVVGGEAELLRVERASACVRVLRRPSATVDSVY